MALKRKIGKIIVTVFAVIVFMIFLIKGNLEENTKQICGIETAYTYYDRKLSAEDFQNFTHDTTYDEMVDKLGPPNEFWGYGSAWPYYELSNGKFVICICSDTIDKIFLANRNERESVILPDKLPIKSEGQKNEELELAKHAEMNVILWALEGEESETHLEDFKDKTDVLLGIYSEEKLEAYTDDKITVNIDYYWGAYKEENVQPLFQVIQIYQQEKLYVWGYEVWEDGWIIEEKRIYVDENLQVEKIDFKNVLEEILDISDYDNLIRLQNYPDSESFFEQCLTVLPYIEDRENNTQYEIEAWGVNEEGEYMFICNVSQVDNKSFFTKKEDYNTYYLKMTIQNNQIDLKSVQLVEQ